MAAQHYALYHSFPFRNGLIPTTTHLMFTHRYRAQTHGYVRYSSLPIFLSTSQTTNKPPCTHSRTMSTIRTIHSDPPNDRPSTPSHEPTRSQTSTPTTVATLTPNGHHRAAPPTPPARPAIPLHPYANRRPLSPHTLTSLSSFDGIVMEGPQTWPEVKRSWWKRLWSWFRGWGFR